MCVAHPYDYKKEHIRLFQWEETIMDNEIRLTKRETKTVAERIPELSAKQKSLVKLHENSDWANWFWTAPVGYLHDDKDRGVTWLVAGKGRVRCIRVWDSDY